jgi:leucyl-tRNA synthetase
MKPYKPREIEPKWQQIWAETGLYRTDDGAPGEKKFFLDMFPYPSGDGLHVGHVRNYTITDIAARFSRMQGNNVLHPIGWDAFGLPTENYAIKTGVSPQVATKANSDNFRAQMKKVGLAFDWDREINSSEPEYYKWTQLLFIILFERGLAYQKESEQWWCDTDKTVLANEQVESGKCWRCGNPVSKKTLKQWFFGITNYADRLLADIEGLDWPEGIKAQQRNWIGKSEGAEINFELEITRLASTDGKSEPTVHGLPKALTVYTTRPDTLFGATFLVVAPEVVKSWMENSWNAPSAVKEYVETSMRRSEIERQEVGKTKTGVDTGIRVIHPFTEDEIEVWVADYVLGGYGTGAIMAVPAHDERDYSFAKAFGLPIKVVIEPVTGVVQDDEELRSSIVAIVKNKAGEILSINWGKAGGNLFIGGGRDAGEDAEACARREVTEETGYKNLKLIEVSETIHHHYIAHSKGGVKRNIEAIGVYFELENDEQESIKHEDDEVGKFTVEWLSADAAERSVRDELHALLFRRFIKGECYSGKGTLTASGKYDGMTSLEAMHDIIRDLNDQNVGHGSTKYKLRDWLISRQRYWGAPIPIIHCLKDGAVAVPNDQLPVVLPELEDYLPTGDGKSPLAKVDDWVNVDCPKCGGPAKRETDTMDTFACSSWYFLRFADPHNTEAAFDLDKVKQWLPVDMYVGGAEHAVLHLLYARFWTKVLFDAKLVDFEEPFRALRNQGMVNANDGRKMSKSYGNVINPNTIIETHGADSLRLYEMFMAPYSEQTSWSDERLGGVSRFLYRTWTLAQNLIENNTQAGEPDGILGTEVDRLTHQTIKKVTDDLGEMRFNTMVSTLMQYVNALTAPAMLEKLILPENANLAQATVRALILMLAPSSVHMSEELWQQLGETSSVHTATWPSYDPEKIKDDLVTIVVQVNGKLRDEFTAEVAATNEELEASAKSREKVAVFLEGKTIVKVIVIPRKIVNFVVKES